MNNILRDKNTIPYTVYLLFAFISVLYIAVFSTATSPIYAIHPESDSDIFIMLGKLLRAGYTPYVDFFDHKGPVIIFIEAIGLSFFSDDRTSIFILQIINLFVVQVLIYRIAALFLEKKERIIIVFSALLLLGFLLPFGNYTEEWCLPFLFLALLYAVQFLVSKTSSFSNTKALVLGVSFAVIFWLRANNASVVCAVVMYIFFIQVSRKDWTSVRNFILFVLAGFLLVSIPIVIYFVANDAYDEMIFATFIFNFKYSSSSVDRYHSLAIIVQNIISEVLPIVLLLWGATLFFIKTKDKSVFLLNILLILWTIVSTQIAVGFSHYMMLNLPLFVFGLVLVLSHTSFLTKHSIWLGAFALVGLLLLSSYRVWRDITKDLNKEIQATHIVLKEAYSLIPANERNQIYAYHMPTYFYMMLDLLPSKTSRYFIYQEGHGRYEQTIFNEINEAIISKKPKWIFIRQYDPASAENVKLYDILEDTYTPEFVDKSFTLYKVK